MASQKIRVCWDTSEAIIDEEEFELIKMMVAEAGADKELCKLPAVVNDLKKQGYPMDKAFKFAHLARGFLNGQTCTYPVTTA